MILNPHRNMLFTFSVFLNLNSAPDYLIYAAISGIITGLCGYLWLETVSIMSASQPLSS